MIADPTPNPVPTQESHALMQQYYDDINHRDYPAAYKLWGAAFHSSTDYCAFVTGYAQTQHNDFSFGNIVQQSDSTVLVPMTIKATEQTPSGTRVASYQINYIVGQENGQWKLLSGSMHQM
jgi:hypothetical protein